MTTTNRGPVLYPKGTIVRIRTTNGGDTTAPLLEDHYRTYDAVIQLRPPYSHCITQSRIKSIEPAEGMFPRGGVWPNS